MNPIAKRVMTALGTAAGVVCAICYVPYAYVLPVLIALAGLVQLEFGQMASRKYPVAVLPGAALGVLWLVGRFYFEMNVLLYLFFALALTVLFRKRYERPLATLGVTMLGFLYIPYMLQYFILTAQESMMHLLYVLAIVKISDMGGFAFGLAFGKHKMCPAISPKKSWEGLAGSVFASCVISCAFMSLTHYTVAKSLAMGTAAALVGTLGDLVESRFKRECEVKDSATFMPAGLGGFLDMFDSLIFAPAILFRFL